MFFKKRNPYKLKESEMTPEEHDIVFPSDDGINFQWGDTYIKADEVTSKGGKYWRQNDDGSVTEFNPSQLRIKVAVDCVIREHNGAKILEESDIALLQYPTPEKASMIAYEINDSLFFKTRSIMATAEGNVVKIECVLKSVFESTYFPAKV